MSDVFYQMITNNTSYDEVNESVKIENSGSYTVEYNAYTFSIN